MHLHSSVDIELCEIDFLRLRFVFALVQTIDNEVQFTNIMCFGVGLLLQLLLKLTGTLYVLPLGLGQSIIRAWVDF